LEDEFLPDGYEMPDDSTFMKFVNGKNKFRVLSSLVTGYEYWKTEDGKDIPVRSKDKPTDVSDGKINPKTGRVDVNHFWHIIVWNYASKSVQELTITQKGIQKYILGLVNDPDWGKPQGYDLIVTKEGEGLLTKYTVSGTPPKEAAKEIVDAYAAYEFDPKSIFE